MSKTQQAEREALDFGMRTLTVGKTIQAIVRAYRRRKNINICMWGPPGIGKSIAPRRAVEYMNMQAAAEGQPADFQFIDVRIVLCDPTDMRGIQYIVNNQVHNAPASFWPKSGRGIILLDEINRAPIMTQNGAFQLVLDKKIMEWTCPEGFQIVAACNRESDGGGVTKMSAGLCNRFIHINVDQDLDEWIQWAVEYSIHPAVLSYHRFANNGGNLNKFSKEEKAFPSPRTWEFVSELLYDWDQFPEQDGERDILDNMILGSLGKTEGTKFITYDTNYKTLPSIDEILKDPKRAKMPDDPSRRYAIASALGQHIKLATIEPIMTYLDRSDSSFTSVAVQDAFFRSRRPDGNKDWCHTDVFTKYARENAAVLLNV